MHRRVEEILLLLFVPLDIKMEKEEPIQLDIEKVIKKKAPDFGKKIPGFVYRFLEKTICQEQMNAILREYADCKGVDFADALLSVLNVKVKLEGEENIPAEGRFTFASNHPLGGLDGVSLVSVFGKKYHSQIKVQVNDLLMNVTPLAPVFLPINKHGRQAKDAADILKNAYESDNQMFVFPAGLVSRLQKGEIRDLEWKKAFISKTIQFQRDVIPIYFEGLNSSFFYRFAYIRKKLGLKFNIEMIYLPSEMFKSKDKTFVIHVGKPIPWQTFDKSRSLSEWAQFVKDKVYELKK